MAQSLSQRSLMHGQSVIAGTRKISSCSTEKDSRFQDTPKVEHRFTQPFLDPSCIFAQSKGTEHMIQCKYLESNQNSMLGNKVYNDDELVKHMSNVPCFLQQVGKDKSIQEKALNFGVLDWRKLEKWKYNERMPVKIHKKTASSCTGSIAMASGPPKMSANLKTSHGVKASLHFGSPRRKSLPSQSSHLNPFQMERKDTCCKEENSFEGIRQPGNLETLSQEFQGIQRLSVDRPQKFHHKVENHGSCCSEPYLNKVKLKGIKKETIPQRKSWSFEQGKHKISLSSNDTIDTQCKVSEKSMDDGVNYTHVSFPADLQNILLVPKHFPKNSCSDSSQFSEPRMSLDGQLAEAIGNRFANSFSPQESGEFCKHVIPIPSEAEGLIKHEKTAKHSVLAEAPKRPDAEQPTVKGRHPSPTSRFGFGLGKMSRTSSFKESSAVPQLSSTNTSVGSGPVMEITTGADTTDKEKGNSSSKGRSSPLRRLLDPLLKKPSSIGQPPNGTMVTRGLCQDKKVAGLSSKSLLQLSVKNGLPFFKLVVGNSTNGVLAAVVEKLPAFGKSDHSMVYSFYSIHEVRRKNMWIQASKSKSCDLGCNILGQMKISTIHVLKSRAKNLDGCAVRECVLYGVDKEQMDMQEPEFAPGKEMAAVVLQNSCEKLNHSELNGNKKLYQDENIDSAVVILPGGVHGMPYRGAPSSLISRWRSGGSCDCGGWDVGCKLQVLTNHYKKDCKILESPMPSSTMDCFHLFVQGREQKSKPAFNLEAFGNGFYSLELDSSISLLEAFATCVALLTCQKFSEILDTNIPGHILEALIETCKPKATTPTPFSRQVPAKYTTCRPPSPVGRI
ncbi:hypothetical protein F511_11430 [Dorcoceras hygrometricum]|uniref:Uncharacterized protein n=1 Tax=Dorcoceras hygrometricum TaxID=472368 RepID=A0A2Z7CXA4_9LAMI|nr:hypothetical protein F511_11430 [Dorcoceras hygrometricum]